MSAARGLDREAAAAVIAEASKGPAVPVLYGRDDMVLAAAPADADDLAWFVPRNWEPSRVDALVRSVRRG